MTATCAPPGSVNIRPFERFAWTAQATSPGLEDRPQRLCEHGGRDLVMGLAHRSVASR